MVAGRVAIHYDSHAINILVFPPRGEEFVVPGGGISGEIKSHRGYSERE